MKTETMISALYKRGYAVTKIDPIPEEVLTRCINATCARFRVKRKDLMSELRTDAIAEARYAAWVALARRGHSHASIAGAFFRDASAVSKGTPKAEFRACWDSHFRKSIEWIQEQMPIFSPVE